MGWTRCLGMRGSKVVWYLKGCGGKRRGEENYSGLGMAEEQKVEEQKVEERSNY
jgi:hypothetical protein